MKTRYKFRLILISTLIWGMAAHGMTLFNTYCWHDDAFFCFSLGYTVSLGRWALACAEKFSRFWGSGFVYSTPLLNGLLTLFFIAVTVFETSRLLNLRRFASLVLLSGIMTVFPVVTAILGYGFTAPWYAFSFAAALWGTRMICSFSPGGAWLAGCAALGCAMGLYQACLPPALAAAACFVILSLSSDRERAGSGAAQELFLKKILHMALGFLLAFAIYLAGVKISMAVSGSDLSEYQGVRSFGFDGMGAYWARILEAYAEFLFPPQGKMRSMFFPGPLRVIHAGAAFLSLWLAAAGLRKRKNVTLSERLIFLASVVLFPVAVNFSHIMTGAGKVHSLMVYGQVFLFVLLACLSERSAGICGKGGRLLILIALFLYCRFSNICYLKAEFFQSQATGYFNRLVSRIESTGGYRGDMPVVYVDPRKKKAPPQRPVPEFESVRLIPYNFTSLEAMINNYAWKEFMKLRCGFDPDVKEIDLAQADPEVQAMPSYPAAGSIRVFENRLVVKF